MITFENEGGFGPEFSTMTVKQHTSSLNCDTPTLEFTIFREHTLLPGNIILTKESALYLAKEIQRVCGEEVVKRSYSGSL